MGKKTSVIDQFKAARLYAITCPAPDGASYEKMVRAACEGGADVVQFRDKHLPHKQLYEIAANLRTICAEHGVLFIVNDLLEVALAAGADGVHLGQDDMATDEARRILHENGVGNFLIGRSTHSLEQALKAEQEGADYIGIGPVFATPTKPTYQPAGLDLVRQVTSRVKTPHVAIGGIDVSNVESVRAAGAARVAVVRAVCGADDVRQAARRMKIILSSSPAATGGGSPGPGDSPPVTAGNDGVRVR
jgi:thiamine-phosphate pyrophosphorylase